MQRGKKRARQRKAFRRIPVAWPSDDDDDDDTRIATVVGSQDTRWRDHGSWASRLEPFWCMFCYMVDVPLSVRRHGMHRRSAYDTHTHTETYG